jgi:hypothetical protein
MEQPENSRKPVNLAFTTFCRSADVPMLELSQYSFNKLKRVNWQRIVVDESEDPIDVEKSSEMGIESVITKDFPRGDTLDGAECVIGMVDTFKEVVDLYNADYVVKMDADVLMLDSKFEGILQTQKFMHFGHSVDLKARNEKGEVVGTLPYCQGPCYAIHRDAIERLPSGEGLREMLQEVDLDNGRLLSVTRKRGYSWPEDECMSRLIWNLYRDETKMGWEDQDARMGHLAFWDYKRYNDGFSPSYARGVGVYDFVDFGKTSPIVSEKYPTWDSRRAVALRNMQLTLAQLT